MNNTASSRKFLIALTLFAATGLVAGCGSDAQVTKTTTSEQSTTLAPAPVTSTTTTTSTQKSSSP